MLKFKVGDWITRLPVNAMLKPLCMRIVSIESDHYVIGWDVGTAWVLGSIPLVNSNSYVLDISRTVESDIARILTEEPKLNTNS